LGCPPLVAAVLIPLGSHPDYTTVILGPESYLEQRGITLKSGDHLWVRGLSAKSIDVYPTVLATSIAQGSNVVGLRTVAGLPLWPSTAQ
jgi:hypothetical protein